MSSKALFIAPNAIVIGHVVLSENVTIWYQTVIRADLATIFIGKNTNVQEHTTIHVSKRYPVTIGANVTIGHQSLIHGCTIEDDALIGMGTTILNGAKIGKGALIGAGSLVTEHQVIEPYTVAFGRPAKMIRKLTEKEIKDNQENIQNYIEEGKKHATHFYEVFK